VRPVAEKDPSMGVRTIFKQGLISDSLFIIAFSFSFIALSLSFTLILSSLCGKKPSIRAAFSLFWGDALPKDMV